MPSRIRRGQLEVRYDRTRPIDEQLDRGGRQHRFQRVCAAATDMNPTLVTTDRRAELRATHGGEDWNQ